jgi:hypothetical protein
MAGPQILSQRIGVRIPFLPANSTGHCELHYAAACQLCSLRGMRTSFTGTPASFSACSITSEFLIQTVVSASFDEKNGRDFFRRRVERKGRSR